MAIQTVTTALEECEKLLKEVKSKTNSRPRLTSALVELNRQVLTTLQNANVDFSR